MSYINANVSRMFETDEPWDCSNSVANLGPNAGQMTWQNALEIARLRKYWLRTPVKVACDAMREWAGECGAWEAAEIAAWTTDECLALFVQNIASELQMLGSNDTSLEECAAKYAVTNWEQESEYPIGSYFVSRGAVRVQYYTGI